MHAFLHISDLHRSGNRPINNDDLISAILTDLERPLPGLGRIDPLAGIIVSGDLVQGLPLDSTEYPDGLTKQYREATEFLARLADKLVNGDRSRVVIVPGNHDVDFNQSRRALTVVDPIPDGDLYERIAAPNSKFRWCWKTRKLFQVADSNSYRSRFDHFATFYREFYAGAKLAYSLDPYRGHNWYQVNGGEMLIAAFNSCDQNDCYNYCGSIADGEISRSQLNRPTSRIACRLLMAVWHHDVEGPPLRTDYMNAEVIPMMIDKGFQVGLHGHHHRSEFRPVTIRISGAQSMAIISSGSLAAGDRDLPPGVNRQYNILWINDDFSSGELFVREMTVPGIFSEGRLSTLGGRSHCTLEWTPRTMPAMPATAAAADVEQVERMLHDRKFVQAAAALENSSMPAHYKHQLLTQALRGAERWPELIQHLANPHSADDLTGAVDAAIKMKGWATAVDILDAADAAGLYPSLTTDLRKRVRAEHLISGNRHA